MSLDPNALINSFLLVAVSEMGDKTQLLAIVLTARFKKPWPIIAGIFVATILNHALASYAGSYVTQYFQPEMLKNILAVLFIAFGFWILIPDAEEELKEESKWGPFATTVVTFFLAEMGDKTQLATIALGAQYAAPVAVTIGSTLGMMTTNGLAVFLGNKLLEKISMKWVHRFASALFILFGLWIKFAN